MSRRSYQQPALACSGLNAGLGEKRVLESRAGTALDFDPTWRDVLSELPSHSTDVTSATKDQPDLAVHATQAARLAQTLVTTAKHNNARQSATLAK
jgi:hypothetical protein